MPIVYSARLAGADINNSPHLPYLSISTALVTLLVIELTSYRYPALKAVVHLECPITYFPASPLLATDPGDATG